MPEDGSNLYRENDTATPTTDGDRRLMRRSRILCFWLALTTLQSPGHAQEAEPLQPQTTRSVLTGRDGCGPTRSDAKSEPIKITDSLILAVPMKYIRYASANCGNFRSGIANSPAAKHAWVGFGFFLPDFSGYTLKRLRESFDVNEVEIAYVASPKEIEGHADHPTNYPSNQLNNVLRYLANPKDYRDIYGLRCYEAKVLKTTMYCYSARAGNEGDGILFTVTVPPYAPGLVNPQMQTDYYSRRYGGVEVAWRTNVKNISRWHEIDKQIWKFIGAWNVAHSINITR